MSGSTSNKLASHSLPKPVGSFLVLMLSASVSAVVVIEGKLGTPALTVSKLYCLSSIGTSATCGLESVVKADSAAAIVAASGAV